MQTLTALLVVTAAACALARPPGPTASPPRMLSPSGPHRERVPLPPIHESDPQNLMPFYIDYKDSPRVPPPMIPQREWLNKEIIPISQMGEDIDDNGDDDYYDNYNDDDTVSPYKIKFNQWKIRQLLLKNYYKDRSSIKENGLRDYVQEQINSPYEIKPNHSAPIIPGPIRFMVPSAAKRYNVPNNSEINKKRNKVTFALTPLDEGYYDEEKIKIPQLNASVKSWMDASRINDVDKPRVAALIEPPRQIRQNPNLSKTKTLVAEHLDELRAGLANKDFRLPVSLLPTNLRWLKISRPDDGVERLANEGESTDKPRLIRIQETPAPDLADSIYVVALLAAGGAAFTIAIFGFAYAWYLLSKKAKAAADVDYPAYGVTGPTIDTSGDRKLAHSAHMYHYQHQKQQIIAMERTGMEQRNGSVSDPESEEENEEGDYTVYECPGFATSGDMEVKNPLFSDDPTPATPGKCEVVKQQPKD